VKILELSKEQRKALLKEIKQKYEQKSKETLLIPIHHLEELIVYLENILEIENCNNTFKYTIKWLNSKGYKDIETIINSFEELGAYCDCEITLNID
jgi:ABC-type phosphate/phosphonate transport system ATPase subunit